MSCEVYTIDVCDLLDDDLLERIVSHAREREPHLTDAEIVERVRAFLESEGD